MSAELKIALSADDKYMPHLSALLNSLSVHNYQNTVTIYLLFGKNLSLENQKKVEKQCLTCGAAFKKIYVDPSRIANLSISKRYPEEIWFRLFLPDLLLDLDRIIWLDSDIIINGDLSFLSQLKIDGFPLAAVRSALYPKWRNVRERLGIEDHESYFNSGMMVMNLKYMREDGFCSKIFDIYENYKDRLYFPDQDILNIIYSKKIIELPLKWNLITSSFFNIGESIRVHGKMSYMEAVQSPVIVHFTTMKPWLYGSSHPYRNVYFKHRLEAGFGCPVYSDKTFRQFIESLIPLKYRVAAKRMLLIKFSEMYLALKYFK